MQLLVLFALIGAGFAIQCWLDVREIRREADGNGWRELAIAWTPFAPGSLLRHRNARSYWLRYRDRDGRWERRLCSVEGVFFLGSAEVAFDAGASESASYGGAPTMPGRIGTLTRWTCVGGFLGIALGIAASFVLYPTSNIAPAYGVILGGPLGLAAGALVGFLRSR
jgi:hypothetical protein